MRVSYHDSTAAPVRAASPRHRFAAAGVLILTGLVFGSGVFPATGPFAPEGRALAADNGADQPAAAPNTPVWGGTPPRSAMRPATTDPAAPTTRSPTTGPATQLAAHILALGADDPADVPDGLGGLLPRELARQAMLIAARDELGWATRDQTLQEPFPTGALELDVRTALRAKLRVRVRSHDQTLAGASIGDRWSEKTGPDLLDLKTPIGNDANAFDKPLDYGPAVAELERLSRTEFVDLLKSRGAAGRPHAPGAAGAVPAAVEQNLAVMSFVTQFAAVREAHATIRRQGESPALLGALVRGYANLGHLTDFLWNASHEAFAARSLLYAERMVAADPKSPEARYHRGYARALVGLHAAALADLEEADRMSAGQPNAKPPAWVGLIRSYCRYDTKGLSDAMVADPAQAPLAGHLCFATVQLCPSISYVVEMGQAILQVEPLSLRVLDRMNRVAGVGPGHTLSEVGTPMLAEAMATRLRGLPGLPASVREVVPPDATQLTDPAAGAAVGARLVAAAGGPDDADEPSWGVLGRMVQEHQFANVQRRARFLVHSLAVDAGDYIAESRPLIADHPYRLFIESYAVDHHNPVRLAAAVKDLTVFDIEYQEKPFSNHLYWAGPAQVARSNAFYKRILAHMDDVAADLGEQLIEWRERPPPEVGTAYLQGIMLRARAVSPRMPEAIAAQIQLDWKAVGPQAAQIEQEFGKQLAVAFALGQHYLRSKQYADAERCLRRYIERAHDTDVYRMLARTRLARGDEDGWLKTLEEVLEKPDYGLEHGRVRYVISRHFMSQGKYERAEPYARAAARTWAGWAMLNAAECYEGLGRWNEAEQLIRDEGERYGDPMAWYVWCVRTGHGDEKAAARGAAEYVRRSARETDEKSIGNRALFYLLQGRTDDASAVFKDQLDQFGSPFDGVHLALIKDAANDAAARDAALDTVTRRGPAFRNPADGQPRGFFVQAATMFRTSLANGGNGKLDPRQVEVLLAPLSTGDRVNTLYFMGRFAELHGDVDAAKTYYRRCAETHSPKSNRVLAAKALRKLGVEVKPLPPEDEERPDGEL